MTAINSIELTRFDAATFEHLVNALATKEIGKGVTGFAPGPDGGRDGYFEGEAEYPSSAQRWSGVWYIQSKFFIPSVSGRDPQKWLQTQVKNELKEFMREESQREFPDNWIIATNVDVSGVKNKGTFDKVREMVGQINPNLAKRTHIWGGQKILNYLTEHHDVRQHYGGLLTSGDVLAKIVGAISDSSAKIDTILRHLNVAQISEQQYTKLEQAGSSSDTSPGIQTLFSDLPYFFDGRRCSNILSEISKSIAENHSVEYAFPSESTWKQWKQQPARSRVWFIRGGPGSGKSTITQFACQIQRAAVIEGDQSIRISQKVRELVEEVKRLAQDSGYWPMAPRVAVHIELRLYAHWYGKQSGSGRGVLSYLASRLEKELGQKVLVGTLKRAFESGRWLFVFDGLDEVPGDVKDLLAPETIKFIDDTLLECKADAMVICTSRPQGYSGQFDELHPSVVDLAELDSEEALSCADPILKIDRSDEDAKEYRSTLKEAIRSPAIQEIMTTPLQSHIMAVVVRDGGRPPERKWQLFSNFYKVIKKREANRKLADPQVAKLLLQSDKLIKLLHNRLGFELHYRAEKSSGAQTSISRSKLKEIISEIVHRLQDDDIEETVSILAEATTERLVLVNTPESGEAVRFDIRPLQEFFAAEYIYESANENGFMDRLRAISSDSHWREVMHFLLSALIEQERRGELAQAITILSEIDDSPLDQRRALARSLSVGGIISLRLLREGVIDSDKRTRGDFRKCLQALLASTDARFHLVSPPPQHSAAWLANVALDTVAENKPSESIGAACVLPIVLEENSLQIKKIGQALENCEKCYLSIFLDSLTQDTLLNYRINSETPVPIWVLTSLLRRVTSEKWYELGKEVLHKIYLVFSLNHSTLVDAAKVCNIDTRIAENLPAIFDENPVHGGGRRLERKHKQMIGGIVQKRVFIKPAGLNLSDWTNEFWNELLEVGGVLRSCALLERAAKQKSSVAIEIFNATIKDEGGLSLLPREFKRQFFIKNICDTDTMIDTSLINADSLGTSISYSVHFTSKNSGKFDWDEIFEELPDFLFHILDVALVENDEETNIRNSLIEWLSSSNNMNKFFRAIENSNLQNLLHFGHISLFSTNFPSFSDRLKRLVAASPVNNTGRFTTSRISFTFNFPADADLFPHLVAFHFFASMNQHSDSRHRHGIVSRVNESIHRYVPDPVEILNVWNDNRQRDNVVAASGILLLSVSPICEVNIKHIYSRIIDLYSQDYSSWLVPSVLECITPRIARGDPDSLDFADELMKKSREDLQARSATEGVMANWREISRTPVHATLANKSSGFWNE